MLLLTHLLAVLGFLSLLLILWRARSSPNKSKGTTLTPEQPGAWQIVGHLLLLGSETPLARTLAAMANKQGPMFRIRLGVHPATVISSQECFTTQDKALASRPKSKAGIHLGYGYASFGFVEYGDFWHKMRKITMLKLLRGFDLATPSDEPVDMTEGVGVTLPKATPVRVVLTPRLPPKLYEQLTAN